MADKFDYEQNKMIVDPSIEKEAKNLEQNPYESIEKQVQAEFNLAWDHQYQKKLEALVRLKMYNNQMRDKGAVGDTTMFTTHNTVLASLYIDKLMTEFDGREEGDDEVAENLNQMYEFDYEEMMKDIIDYDWDWDTCFFGRGILYLSEFIRDPDNGIFVPCPEIVDPTTFLRDPRGVAINGNTRTGKNSCRFFGREVRMTRDAMENNINFLPNIDWKDIKFGNGLKSLTEESHKARTEAQGNQYAKFVNANESKLGDNAEYQLTEWNTHWKVKGDLKKVVLYLANDRKKVVGFRTIGNPDHLWEAVDRPLYPTSHDWDGTSIPDLTEDKQRHRAVAQNLGMRAMTADLYPNYIYDQNKIKNRNDLNIGFNKMTPSDGNPNDAIVPQRKAAPNMQLLQFIYNSLDLSAQKATATPDIQQGMNSTQDRTLGENNMVAANVDTRYSLSAKVFGWSEKAFGRQYYTLYKENFADGIDTKIIRISGAFGAKWRPLDRSNIIARVDPDVSIESKTVSRAKQLEDRNGLTAYFSLVLADPTANRRYAYRKLGKLYGMKKDEMDRLLPPTIDERQAEDENDLLNEGKFVRVLPEQDHNVHLEMHAKAKEGKNTTTHIETHKHALMIKKTNPDLFPTPEDQGDTSYTPPGSAGTNPTPTAGGNQPIRPSVTS